jgi:hypothetical protein
MMFVKLFSLSNLLSKTVLIHSECNWKIIVKGYGKIFPVLQLSTTPGRRIGGVEV